MKNKAIPSNSIERSKRPLVLDDGKRPVLRLTVIDQVDFKNPDALIRRSPLVAANVLGSQLWTQRRPNGRRRDRPYAARSVPLLASNNTGSRLRGSRLRQRMTGKATDHNGHQCDVDANAGTECLGV